MVSSGLLLALVEKSTASSNRLYLAINSPFADLAENTDINVSIVADLGSNEVSNYDYDPSLSLSDPRTKSSSNMPKVSSM